MLNYNRIAYELDSINVPSNDVQGISFLHHFDQQETTSYNGNATHSTDGFKFGKSCAYFPDTESNITISNNTSLFNLNSLGNYEFEAFIKLKDRTEYCEAQGYKFYGGHTFKVFNSTLTWSEANSACAELSGHVATSTSEYKNSFLTSFISTTTWLGANYEVESEAWLWTSGETWDYSNWADSQLDYSDDAEHFLELAINGSWSEASDNITHAYICEWDYDFRAIEANIFNIAGLSLTEKFKDKESPDYRVLTVSCPAWGTPSTSQEVLLKSNVWYHLILRISSDFIRVFINGVNILSAYINDIKILTPEKITLGGYVGYMDEFIFRRNADTDTSLTPTFPYSLEENTNNAPVSRVTWSCENLPDGLTLSSAGVLSGHPITTGTYECNVKVTTNWGTTNEIVRVVVE